MIVAFPRHTHSIIILIYHEENIARLFTSYIHFQTAKLCFACNGEYQINMMMMVMVILARGIT